jgi:long-subunit fatty acid transport protein
MPYRTNFTFLNIIFWTLIVLSLSCHSVQAQDKIPQKVISASTPNPVGSGARAVGMGGAFIAVADDATAASWNPAGLTQLKKPEISFALSYFRRRDDFTADEHPETSGVQKSLSKDLNYLSIAYPFEFLERNMIVSLNYQLLYEFDRNIKTTINEKPIPPFSNPLKHKINFRQSGDLRTLSPAYAIEITPDFSLGVTFNIWTDKLFWSNGWESDTTIKTRFYRGAMLNSRGVLSSIGRIKDRDRYYGFSGFNMNIGFLWDINQFVTVGGVVKTPFTADIEHERVVTNTVKVPGSSLLKKRWRQDEDVELDMPLSYGLGVALRFSDRFTLSLDVFRTEWDHFRLEDGNGNRISPTTGKPSHESPIEETTQVRLGAEYLFIFTKTVIPLRWGVFYDPEPSEKNPEDFWGVSLGAGVSIGDLIFDCAYQFRYGNDVEGDVFLDLPSTGADVMQHLFMVSFIYHF